LLYPWGNERVSVELTWKPGSAYRLRVLDALTLEEVGEPVGATDPDQGGAVVRFLPEKGRRYRIQVQRVGQLAGPFRLIVLGGDLAYSTPHGSIAFPADGPEVIAVGAVDADGERLPYSCCGLPQGLLKPDFTAPVPFPSLWRSRPFTGTSAAAPQAAGLAALCWSRHPDWTAHRVRRYLQAAAIDLASPGPDCETGHGLIRLPPPHEERWP
ncbi:MAG: S8 family serine peptidase, partial [Gemmataceae bacterium]|nr:S8 family serine peptidase [Gemmataceae bacterium]